MNDGDNVMLKPDALANHGFTLRPDALARRWNTSTGRLANDRCAGRGPKFIRIGTSIRYRLSDIEAYEQANTVQPVCA